MSRTFHEEERKTNAAKWEEKPELRKEYAKFYQRIKAKMIPGPSLELGSGLCHSKEWIPDMETSEPIEQGNADSIQSAYHIEKPNESLNNLVALDVWHHLEYPQAALQEWQRVLQPGGKVILVEPAMGFLGNLVFTYLHHEKTGWDKNLRKADVPIPPNYFTAQSSAHRIFLQKEIPDALIGWEIEIQRWAALSYLATGGYKRSLPGGNFLRKITSLLETPANKALPLTACRMLICLTKK